MTLVLVTYDVVCAAGPSYSTQRQEAAASMQAILQAAPQLMQVAGDLLVKNLDWPGADGLARRLEDRFRLNWDEEEQQSTGFSKQYSRWEQAIQQREQMIQQLMQGTAIAQAQEGNNQAEGRHRRQEG